MAEDKKISQLTVLESIEGTEMVPVVKDGENYRVNSELFKGMKGESGVYVGDETPTDDSTVWIDPTGDASTDLATKGYVDTAINNALTSIENGSY